MDLGGVFEYTTFVCAHCGFQERYMHEKVVEYRLNTQQLQRVNPAPEGPFR